MNTTQQQFRKQYSQGKKSELESLDDLSNIFHQDLKISKDKFAHFDFYSDDLEIELKTRKNTFIENGIIHHKCRNGRTTTFSSLWFDYPKLEYAIRHPEKAFYVVWKLADKYYYWQINTDPEAEGPEYYIEEQFADYGTGRGITHRKVINVHACVLTQGTINPL